jgi:hypothetical protein
MHVTKSMMTSCNRSSLRWGAKVQRMLKELDDVEHRSNDEKF